MHRFWLALLEFFRFDFATAATTNTLRMELLEDRCVLATLNGLPLSETAYFSLKKAGTIASSDGSLVEFTNQDVLGVNIERDETGALLSYEYFLHFDGSQFGLGARGENIDALSILDDGRLLVSTIGNARVEGLRAADEDLLMFTPDAPNSGPIASGSWSLYFDGSDVGLTDAAEDVVAASVLADGRLAIATKDGFTVDGLSGAGQDVLLFTPTSLGADTAGSWEILLDGSAAELNASAERIDALHLHDEALVYLSTLGNFRASGLTGADEDIFAIDVLTGAVASQRYVDGSQMGLGSFDIDAIHLTASPAEPTPQQYTVERLNNGQPIITQDMFADLGVADDGANINGPSVIRIPDWIPAEQRADPTANYYLYFADHGGDYIRMAWAAEVEGPWQLFNVGSGDAGPGRGVLDMDLGGDNNSIIIGNGIRIQGHIASPDVFVDDANQRIVMYFHGPARPDGQNVGQKTFVATSANGLNFNQPDEGGQAGHGIRPVILGNSYFRVFEYGGELYSISNSGSIYRAPSATDPWTAPVGFDFSSELWQVIADPFGSDHVRHVGLRVVNDTLEVFYTRIGDAPERIMLSKIDLTNEPTTWQFAGPLVEIMSPTLAWEGAGDPLEPSSSGIAPEGVRQLRDPFIFEDGGRTFLFYAGRGENAIGLAELHGSG